MRVDWYGQSAFRLTGDQATVFIDPFDDLSPLAGRGIQFDYAAIAGVNADVVLVTHEHPDHNGVEAIEGEPTVLRSTAGKLDSPIGEVVAVASEHDPVAGTQRGPNTIFVFELDGLRVAHFGDFGQNSLRDEQAEAIGEVDLMFLPVGGGPTIDAEQAATIVARLRPGVVVPMHYRTPRISFLETAEPFLERMARVQRETDSGFELPSPTAEPSAAGDGEPLVIVPAAP